MVEVINIEFIELDESVAVYDIEVPIDKSFQCGGVVLHNSPICRSLDKKIMPLDKAVYPPYHFNCRSRTILVYRGMKEPAKRASEHGVTDNVSYYEWLKTQSPDFQDEALGKARGKLFREGGLTPERFSALQLDRNFEPLTLDEMRRLEPLVFKKVFDSP